MGKEAFDIASAAPRELGLKVLEEISSAAPNLYDINRYILAGAQLEIQDAEGNTPLLLATLRDRTGAAQLLINAGANVTATDARGNLPFTHADANHNLALMKALIDRDAARPPRSENLGSISSDMWDRHIDFVAEKIAAAEAQETRLAILRPYSFRKPA